MPSGPQTEAAHQDKSFSRNVRGLGFYFALLGSAASPLSADYAPQETALDFSSMDVPEYTLESPRNYKALFNRSAHPAEGIYELPNYFYKDYKDFHDIALLIDHRYLGEINWRDFTLELASKVLSENDSKYQGFVEEDYFKELEQVHNYEPYAPLIAYLLYENYLADFLNAVDAPESLKQIIDDAIDELIGRLDPNSKIISGSQNKAKDLTLADSLAKASISDDIENESYSSFIIDEDTGVLEIRKFEKDHGGILTRELRSLTENGAKSFIIDLRGNSGGYVLSTTELADRVLPEGSIMHKFFRHKDPVHVRSTPDDILDNAKIAVLVDNSSASASEIFASAMRENHRATIIGERTYGKGTIQFFYDLPNGDELKLTGAFSITPYGNSFQETGMLPDIYIGNWDPEDKNTRERAFENPLHLEEYRLAPEFECHVKPVKTGMIVPYGEYGLEYDHATLCAIEHLRDTENFVEFEQISP